MNIDCENMSGRIDRTGSSVSIERVTLELSKGDAWALCNLLTNSALEEAQHRLEIDQLDTMRRIGQAVGAVIDHHSRHNLGKFAIGKESEVLAEKDDAISVFMDELHDLCVGIDIPGGPSDGANLWEKIKEASTRRMGWGQGGAA